MVASDRRGSCGEDGFSLVELLMVTTITAVLGLVVGMTISTGLRMNATTQNRFVASQSVGLASVLWLKDAHRTESLEVPGSGCGTATTPLAKFSWTENGHNQSVSWGTKTVAGSLQLLRSVCATTGSGTTTKERAIVSSLPSSVAAVTCDPTSCPSNFSFITLTIPGANPGETITLYADRMTT